MTTSPIDRRIQRVAGRAMTLRGNDIDTDQIIPARFLKWITFKGLEAHVFEDARLEANANGIPHPVDDKRFAGASILLVNDNFGCGSSREHAPQALHRAGIKAVIGESFGEIFAGNCVAIGLPCVVVGADTIAALQAANEADPSVVMTLDLVNASIVVGNHVYPVEIAEGRRLQYIEGTWDPTAVLLSAGSVIDAKMRGLGYAA